MKKERIFLTIQTKSPSLMEKETVRIVRVRVIVRRVIVIVRRVMKMIHYKSKRLPYSVVVGPLR